MTKPDEKDCKITAIAVLKSVIEAGTPKDEVEAATIQHLKSLKKIVVMMTGANNNG